MFFNGRFFFIFKNAKIKNMNIILWLIVSTVSSVKKHWNPIFPIIIIALVQLTFINLIYFTYNFWTSMTDGLSGFAVCDDFEFFLIFIITFFVRVSEIQLDVYWFSSGFIFLVDLVFYMREFWSRFVGVNLNYFSC